MTDEERFWSKVDRNGPVPAHRPGLGSCWTWTASGTRGGYGKFRLSKPRRHVKAHRHAFFLTYGYYPENGCHHCDNPACCNPSHIFDGTRSDNMRDCVAKSRHSKRRQRGEQHHFAKLRITDIAAIRRRRAVGECLASIAADYGVVYQTVQRIIEGKTWKEAA